MATALAVLGLLGAVMTVAVEVPFRIKQQVLQKVRTHPSSLTFNVPFYLSVYFFDVLNPSEVLRGLKPQVRERGPSVYRESRHQSSITFHGNDTGSFREHRSFEFQPDQSSGSESDHVCTTHTPVLSAATREEKEPVAGRCG